MSVPWARVAATAEEIGARVRGDEIVPAPDVVMDRGIDVLAPPEDVWPWLVQLGKWRAGWYLPRRIERFLPRGHRVIRRIDPRWQDLAVGDLIPDYGGREETFEVAELHRPYALVFRSRRGRVEVSWAIVLRLAEPGTRIHLRLRLGGLRRVRLAKTGGELVDLLTIMGLAAGLRERVGRQSGGTKQGG